MLEIHFLGINGSGMVGVACLAKISESFNVSGCDINKDGNYSEQLKVLGIKVESPQSVKHLEGIDKLIISPAILFNDKYKEIEEVTQAKERNIEVLKWQEFLDKYLVNDKKFIAICGTHGKTSTSTIMSNLLQDLGCNISALIGGINPKWNRTFNSEKNSEYFVCEADEYGNNFHAYHPSYIIFNNIEMEHPEFFKDYEEYEKNFIDFFKNIKDNGKIIFNYDDEKSLSVILKSKNVFSEKNVQIFGFSNKKKESEYKFINLVKYSIINNNSFEFNKNKYVLKNISGIHNIHNIIAALTLENEMNLNNDNLKDIVENAILPKRRMEVIFENEKVKIFDDYAHHHTQVYHNLNNLSENIGKNEKIIAVLEPHLISRFKNNYKEYLDYMEMASYSIITKFFKSRESNLEDLDMEPYLKNRRTMYIENFDDVCKKVFNIIESPENKNIKFNIVVMGAGNSYKLSKQIKDNLLILDKTLCLEAQ